MASSHGQDEDGWFAVLAVGPGSGVWGNGNGGHSGGIRLDRLAAVLTDAAVPVSSVSVVSQCVPAPNAVLDRQSRAAQSYRQLLHNDVVLADQAVWVTVRLSAADATQAAASPGGRLDRVAPGTAAPPRPGRHTLAPPAPPARVPRPR